MTKREKQLFDDMDGSAAYWQYLHKSEEPEGQQLYKQESRYTTDDSGIILFGILFTIGFLALLAITTLRTIL